MEEPIIIVSGLPRSGTSLMMQMLVAGGVPVLSDALRSADESNPRGYFEFEPVKKLRAEKSWLERARGHAVKIIHLLLRELPVDGSFAYRVLFMERALSEVLASQRKMLAREGKPGADDGTLARIYESQLSQTRAWLQQHSCFAVLPIEHQRVMAEPRRIVEDIALFLGRELNKDAMVAAVDPSLYRERSCRS